MRYDAAPRTERAPTAPAKAVEIRVLRVTRLMEQSSGISVLSQYTPNRALWSLFFHARRFPGSADVPSAIVAAGHRSGLQPLLGRRDACSVRLADAACGRILSPLSQGTTG